MPSGSTRGRSPLPQPPFGVSALRVTILRAGPFGPIESGGRSRSVPRLWRSFGRTLTDATRRPPLNGASREALRALLLAAFIVQ
jgi:hypothetical protein